MLLLLKWKNIAAVIDQFDLKVNLNLNIHNTLALHRDFIACRTWLNIFINIFHFEFILSELRALYRLKHGDILQQYITRRVGLQGLFVDKGSVLIGIGSGSADLVLKILDPADLKRPDPTIYIHIYDMYLKIYNIE